MRPLRKEGGVFRYLHEERLDIPAHERRGHGYGCAIECK
jgi:hypothetical protein